MEGERNEKSEGERERGRERGKGMYVLAWMEVKGGGMAGLEEAGAKV